MPGPNVALSPRRPSLWPDAGSSFGRKAALVVALAGVAALTVVLADVLLLAFGAVLVAVLLHAVAAPLARRTSLGRAGALAVAVVLISAALGGSLWLFGREAAVQAAALGELIPRAWGELQQRLAGDVVGDYLLSNLRRLAPADGLLAAVGPRLVRDAAAAGAAAVIVAFAGLYLAFHPDTYLRGLVRLVPPSVRGRAATILAACGEALNRWLIGQLVSMVLVGVTTGIGLWVAGVPSPLALGALAGLGQFVPVVGPAAAMIPGLVVGAAQGLDTLAWAALVYVAAMQLEANVITPLVLRQMVELPMAVTLFAVLAMGVLLGPLGVLFATPLAVVAYVLVRMVYVEGVLGDPPAPPRTAHP